MNRKFGATNFLLFLWGFLAANLSTTSGDLTVIGDQNGAAETSKSLPDYWEQETSPEAIEQVINGFFLAKNACSSNI
jgi:hypothetical protein